MKEKEQGDTVFYSAVSEEWGVLKDASNNLLVHFVGGEKEMSSLNMNVLWEMSLSLLDQVKYGHLSKNMVKACLDSDV